MFQIWINLPKLKKCAPLTSQCFGVRTFPAIHIRMSKIKTEVTVIAGHLFETKGLPPAPNSWANDPENEVCIWTLTMEPEAQWTLHAHGANLNRSLYYFQGKEIELEDKKIITEPYDRNIRRPNSSYYQWRRSQPFLISTRKTY